MYCTNIQLTDNLHLTAQKQVSRHSSTLQSEVSEMKRLQKWFDQIAGVAQGESERLARAREIFASGGIDEASLKKPACWRRKARVQYRNA